MPLIPIYPAACTSDQVGYWLFASNNHLLLGDDHFLVSKFQISFQMSNFEYDLNEIQETLSSQLLSRRALISFPFHVEEKSQRDVNCMSAMMMMMMMMMMITM